MGTPQPAAQCLKALINSKESIVAVITQPDRPKGRGLKMTSSPVKEIALQNNIEVHQPEKIRDKDVISMIKVLAPELIVIVAYGRILPKEILDIPKLGAINVHASLLPRYRGAAPVQWAIMNGDRTTGVTILKVIEALDAGDMILQRSVPIASDDTTSSLTPKIFEAGAELLLEAVSEIKKGTVKYVAQDEKLVTLAPTIKKEDGVIDWKLSAAAIVNKARACYPWPVAYTYLHDKMFRIFSAEIGLASDKYEPGEVVDCVKGEGFLVGAGSGTVFVREAQLESGKMMNAWDFVVGRKIKVGDFLPN